MDDGMDARRKAIETATSTTRRHGILLVPAIPPEQADQALPLTCQLMCPKPYPWGEIHVTARAFADFTFESEAERQASSLSVASLPQPTLRVTELAVLPGRKSGRNNLVALIESTDLGTLVRRPEAFVGCERFSRDAFEPLTATYRATLGYGFPRSSLDEGTSMAVIEELNKVRWEFALVERIEGHDCRMLQFCSATGGVRTYYTDAV